jgi:transcriptional regulatory protein GAL4
MTSVIPSESDQPTLYSSFKVQSELHVAANSISNRLLCAASISAKDSLALNKPLLDWVATVPKYFQLDQPQVCAYDWYVFARSKLWWRYWNLQIILFRPILLRAAMNQIHGRHLHVPFGSDQCSVLCLESARRTITTIDQYVNENPLTRLAAWYSLCVVPYPVCEGMILADRAFDRYFLFHAALIPSVCLCAEPLSPNAAQWRTDLDTTRRLLSTNFADNPLASRSLEVLERLVPGATPQGGVAPTGYLEPSMIDFSIWPMDTDDPLNAFGWPELSQDL